MDTSHTVLVIITRNVWWQEVPIPRPRRRHSAPRPQRH